LLQAEAGRSPRVRLQPVDAAFRCGSSRRAPRPQGPDPAELSVVWRRAAVATVQRDGGYPEMDMAATRRPWYALTPTGWP